MSDDFKRFAIRSIGCGARRIQSFRSLFHAKQHPPVVVAAMPGIQGLVERPRVFIGAWSLDDYGVAPKLRG
jgi:hypothetical protein